MAGLPNGADGLDDGFNPFGQTNTLSALPDLTYDNIVEYFQDLLQGNSTLEGASTQLFDVILGGFQTLTEFLDLLATSITGGGGGLTDIQDFLADRWADLGDLFTGLLSKLDTSAFQNLLNYLFDGFSGTSGSTGKTVANVFSALGAMFGDLGDLGSALNQIGDVLTGALVTPISSAVADVVDWFSSLTDFQNTTTSNQVNLQNFQIAAMTSGWRNPSWVCRYPISDVTYPECLNIRHLVFGDTDAASAGTAHTHPMEGLAYAAPAGRSTLQNASRGGVITISNATIMDTIGMHLWRASGSALDNVFMELFRENEDLSWVRIFSQDVSASITTTSQLIEVTVPAVIVAQGERYVVRIRNASTTSTTLWVFGGTQSTLSPDLGFLTSTSTNSLKTSWTAAEFSSYNLVASSTPWAMMAAKTLAATDQSFSDDFNRSNIGGLWSLKSNTSTNQIGINGNKAAFSGTTDGNQNAIYIRPTGGDKMRVEGNVSDSTLALTGPRLGFILCSNRDFSELAYLGINNSTAKIYTGSSTSLTERASVNTTFNDVFWAFEYDPSSTTFTAYKDGQAIGLSWIDSGAVVPHGRDHRYGGIRISRATLFNAGRIDNFTVKDWT